MQNRKPRRGALSTPPTVRSFPVRRTARRSFWRFGLFMSLALCMVGLGLRMLWVPIPHEVYGPPDGLVPSLPFALTQPDTLLSQKLALLTAVPRLRTGLFVLDLDRGRYVAQGSKDAYPAASTIKLPILLALLQDIDRGLVSWNEKLTLTPPIKVSGSGFLQYRPLGSQFRIWEVAGLMITDSDNTATEMLIRRLGGRERLNQRFLWWGLTQTALRAQLPDIEGQNTTSPQDLAIVLRYLDRSLGLELATRDRAMDILTRVENRSLLPTGLVKVEPTARIAHKTGTIGKALGDAGIINLPNGRRYILVALVERPREDSRARTLIQNISTQVAQLWSTAAIAVPAKEPASVPSPRSPHT